MNTSRSNSLDQAPINSTSQRKKAKQKQNKTKKSTAAEQCHNKQLQTLMPHFLHSGSACVRVSTKKEAAATWEREREGGGQRKSADSEERWGRVKSLVTAGSGKHPSKKAYYWGCVGNKSDVTRACIAVA